MLEGEILAGVLRRKATKGWGNPGSFHGAKSPHWLPVAPVPTGDSQGSGVRGDDPKELPEALLHAQPLELPSLAQTWPL